MKRNIGSRCLLAQNTYKSTLVIDKNGLSVVDKNPSHQTDDECIEDFLKSCINMDQWQHSWHMVHHDDCRSVYSGETRPTRCQGPVPGGFQNIPV